MIDRYGILELRLILLLARDLDICSTTLDVPLVTIYLPMYIPISLGNVGTSTNLSCI